LVAHTVSRIACALYWFHPLVWTAAKRLRAESEQACDDLALLSGAQASDYAEHLLEIVTRVKHSRTPAMAMAMATRSEFEGRMLAILDPERRRRGPSRLQSVSLVGSLVALTMVVGLAAPAASRAASPAPRPAASPTMALAGDTLASDSLTAAPHTNARSLANGTANGMAQTMADTGRDVSAPLPDAALLPRRAPASLPVAPPADAARPAAPVNAAVQLGLRVAMELGLPIASAASGLSSSTMTKTDSSARAKILATVLRGDSSASLRRVAAWGLEPFVSEPVAAQALIEALRRDADPAVREVSAWALSSSDHAPAVREALIAAAQRESVPLVLRSVVRALGEQGDQNDAAIVDALVSTLGARSATSAPVREMTAWALGSVSPAKVPTALLALLRDSDVTVRKTAAWAVHAIEDERAVPALVDAMRSETDPNAQFAMVRALASLGDAAVPALTALLDDKNPAIRGAAVRSLAGGGSMGPWPMPRPEPRPNPGR
jgi:HEAT repeat protein